MADTVRRRRRTKLADRVGRLFVAPPVWLPSRDRSRRRVSLFGTLQLSSGPSCSRHPGRLLRATRASADPVWDIDEDSFRPRAGTCCRTSRRSQLVPQDRLNPCRRPRGVRRPRYFVRLPMFAQWRRWFLTRRRGAGWALRQRRDSMVLRAMKSFLPAGKWRPVNRACEQAEQPAIYGA